MQATYRLMPRLRQNGRRSSSSCRFVSRCVPNHTGGGDAKMSARACVANTKVNQNGAASRTTPAPTSSSVATRTGVRASALDIACPFLAEQAAVAVRERRDDEEQQPGHGRRGAE